MPLHFARLLFSQQNLVQHLSSKRVILRADTVRLKLIRVNTKVRVGIVLKKFSVSTVQYCINNSGFRNQFPISDFEC